MRSLFYFSEMCIPVLAIFICLCRLYKPLSVLVRGFPTAVLSLLLPLCPVNVRAYN